MRFSDITGHTRAKAALREMADSGEVPHALLISGPEGIGKLALARAFGAYLQCTARTPDGDACGRCPACRQNDALNFPDTIYIYPTVGSHGSSPLLSEDYADQWRDFLKDAYPADSAQWKAAMKAEGGAPAIKVNEATEIIRRMNLSAYSSDYKVLIMWQPERMNQEAANRLLKLIEEPPEGCIFILVSNASHEILPTIFSRTRRINLRPLHPEEVEQWALSDGASADAAASAARLASGSLLTASAIIKGSAERDANFDMFAALMRLAWRRDVSGLRRWSEDTAALKRERVRGFLSYAASLLRESFICNYADERLIALTPKERAFVQPFSPFVNGANIEAMAKEMSDADAAAASNANLRILLFDLAIRMIINIRKK